LSYNNNLTGVVTPSSVAICTTVDGVEKYTTHLGSNTNTYSGTITKIVFLNWVGATGGSLDNIQLEVGTVRTDFEPYKAGETVVTTPSEGAELTSISPNMTIYTDNAEAVVTATYNKDSNIVIEKLTQAIISLGGNI
jgi:hypothetical protein